MSDVVWSPSDEMIEEANITQFMNTHGIESYDELIERSTRDIEWYWDAVINDLQIEFYNRYSDVLDQSKGIPWTEWFTDGKMNIAHNILDRHVNGKQARQTCLIYESEDGDIQEYTYKEMHELTNRTANAMEEYGVEQGDTVGLYMPMTPEVVAQLIACFKLGAIAVPIFSGFAPKAVVDRLKDADVQFVFTADGSWRRGNKISIKEKLDEALEKVPSVEDVIVLDRFSDLSMELAEDRDTRWEDFIDGQSPKFLSESLPSMHPAMILYTSGTTGKPKGTVHSHAGTLVKTASEIAYSFDTKKDDLFWWLSDIGWMMGPWMITGTMHLGSTAFIYEGAPDHPGPDRLWDMIERHQVNIFGISPTAIRMLMEEGTEPVEKHNLSSLRILGSTGEPWDEESWKWFFKHVGKEECPIINISGGTDIMGCFLAPLPIKGLKPCTLQGPSPGMDIDVFNEDGESTRDEVGYLVCKQPAPSMTRGLWNKPAKYIEEYWSKWDNIWNHGDWAKVDEDGYWFLYGRADDTINVAGRRVGPAEVEDALMDHEAVAEAAAIGIPDEIKGEKIGTFVVLSKQFNSSEELRNELISHVADLLGKVDRPSVLEFVPDLPKTRSAKIMRRVIRSKYIGEEDIGDLSSCQNPESIENIPVAS